MPRYNIQCAKCQATWWRRLLSRAHLVNIHCRRCGCTQVDATVEESTRRKRGPLPLGPTQRRVIAAACAVPVPVQVEAVAQALKCNPSRVLRVFKARPEMATIDGGVLLLTLAAHKIAKEEACRSTSTKS